MSRPFWTYGPDSGVRNPILIGPEGARCALACVTTSASAHITTLHHGGHGGLGGKYLLVLTSMSSASSVVESFTSLPAGDRLALRRSRTELEHLDAHAGGIR